MTNVWNGKIVLVRGGDQTVTNVLNNADGWLYGTRHDYAAYAPVYMLDVAFHKWEKLQSDSERAAFWAQYLTKVRQHQPQVAMAVDYLHPSQRWLLYRQIRDLRALGVQVMVCPKFAGAVAHIPSWCIVAVSVPTTYAGFMPDPSELTGRRVHLLGGHPDQLAFLIHEHYTNAQIVSVDLNVFMDKAKKGQYWSDVEGRWVSVRGQNQPTEELKVRSARNITTYLRNAPRRIWKYRRVEKCRYTQPLL